MGNTLNTDLIILSEHIQEKQTPSTCPRVDINEQLFLHLHSIWKKERVHFFISLWFLMSIQIIGYNVICIVGKVFHPSKHNI